MEEIGLVSRRVSVLLIGAVIFGIIEGIHQKPAGLLHPE
jgi:hypothetical protein